MSRREPAAVASGSWPSTFVAPAWFTITFASTCGRWLVERDELVVRRGLDRVREGAELGDEPVHEP